MSEKEPDSRLDIITQRGYKVAKGNEIIQQARYDLTMQELKVLSFCISRIKPTDAKGTAYTFTVKEFCRVCGIDETSGSNYEDAKSAIKSVADKSFYIMGADGKERLFRWFGDVIASRGSGTISVTFGRAASEYLFDLMGNFSQYELLAILPMASKYSIRIYELLKSASFSGKQRKRSFDLDKLKRQLGAENYDRYPDFRRKVLDTATREINEFSDLEISYEPVKTGRKVTGVTFYIKTKGRWESLKSAQRAQAVLDGDQLPGQMSLTDYPGVLPEN